MRADGRRLGRIIGQLDDLLSLVEQYQYQEGRDEPGKESRPMVMHYLYHVSAGLQQARENAQGAVDDINGTSKS